MAVGARSSCLRAAPRGARGRPRPLTTGGPVVEPFLMLAANRPLPKIAFVSPHCVMDFTNGAATATLDGLALLARSGFECQAFCGTRMDAWEEVRVEEILAGRGVRYMVRNAQIGATRGG